MSSTTKRAAVDPGVSNRALRRAQQERQAKQRKLLFLGGALAIALAVVAGLILLNRDNGSTSSLPAIVAARLDDTGIPQSGRVVGDPNAPVTLIEYADFQCPFCEQFFTNVEPSLLNDYVKTGKVKIEFRDLAFLDDRVGSYGESDMAAEAAACAIDQGKYLQFHDTLFANQHGENVGSFTKDRLRQIAQLVGLDMTAFNSCFDSRAHQQEIATIKDEASQAGVNSTPTLFVDGAMVANPLDYATVKSQIDAALGG